MKVMASYIFNMKHVSDKSKISRALTVRTSRNWFCLCLSQVSKFRYNLVEGVMHSSWNRIKVWGIVVFSKNTNRTRCLKLLVRKNVINLRNICGMNVSDTINSKLREVFIGDTSRKQVTAFEALAQMSHCERLIWKCSLSKISTFVRASQIESGP